MHGTEGKGNGRGARDLTTGPFKGGSTARDIYLRISTGMEGTAMRAVTNTSEKDRWNLAYFVESLCKAQSCKDPATSPKYILFSKRLSKRLQVDDPYTKLWDTAPKLTVKTSSLWNTGALDPELTIRSIHDGNSIAFLLEWPDATRDVQTVRPEEFADSVAMQISAGPSTPSLAMGSQDIAVTIWHWKADWQEQLDQGSRRSPKDVHPWMIDEQNQPQHLAALQSSNLIYVNSA
ncbi:MAG: hypothetical protein JO028_07185 [Acidobacteriaceae bacterium]|nr:hypothetical protein [Acidobacteriaceae bacterium]